MKKILSVLVFALMVATAASANGIDVPKKITTNFKTKYPTAQKVTWSFDEDDETYLADFLLSGNPAESIFGKDGTWLESWIEITTDELPDAAAKYLNENHESDEISSVLKVESPQETTYQVSVDGEGDDEEDDESTYTIVLVFDADGNLMDE